MMEERRKYIQQRKNLKKILHVNYLNKFSNTQKDKERNYLPKTINADYDTRTEMYNKRKYVKINYKEFLKIWYDF